MDERTGDGEGPSGALARADGRLIRRLFDEAMDLIATASDYLDGPGRAQSHALAPSVGLVYAGESMRLTTRLMQVMAWLLAQRAVHDGEMALETAVGPDYRLGAQRICLGPATGDVAGLPPALVVLLDQSEALYRRIARLERLLQGAPLPPRPGRFAGPRLVSG